MSDDPTALAPTQASPITEADPNSINELIGDRLVEIFNKPPLLVSDDDLRLMVQYYQKERARFKQESAEKEQRPRTVRRKAPQSVAEALATATPDLI